MQKSAPAVTLWSPLRKSQRFAADLSRLARTGELSQREEREGSNCPSRLEKYSKMQGRIVIQKTEPENN